MKKGIVQAVALCTLTLAAPAAAERFYVPVLGTTAADGSPLATKVLVTSADGVERPIAARFLDAMGGTGGERAVTARAGGHLLADLAPANKAGLIAIDGDEDLGINAWLAGRGGAALAEVPVFTPQEIYQANLDVPLGGLPGRRAAMASLAVGAANLSEKTAFCRASLYDKSESRLLAEIPFEVEPMSLTHEKAPASVGGGRVEAVRVTCDQSFYPFAVAADKSGLRPTVATGIGPNGACTAFLTLTQLPGSVNYIATVPPGVFHTASKAKPKGILCLKATKELKIAKATFEWDVTVGPWSKRDSSGMHNLAYLFLDRYRSGVVGNVNAAGPNKNILKFMQNVGMPKGSNTNQKSSYLLQKDLTYHFVYTYDAASKKAKLQAFLNGVEVNGFDKEVKPGNNQTLIVRPYGSGGLSGLALVAEFGNNNGQHHPEMETWDWKYANFRVVMVPK
jgi:hypothetical protein